MKKYFQIIIITLTFGSLIVVKRIFFTETPQEPGAPSSTTGEKNVTVNNSGSIYKDGTYTGTVEDAYYGIIQSQVLIQNGAIKDVVLLQYPNDNPTSISVNTQAYKIWRQETIKAQSASIDIVSGASESSAAFIKSTKSALLKAQG